MSDTASTVLLGTEKVSTLLKRYAIPSIIAMTASSLYNVIDSIFIGHGVGALAISGLAVTLPLMNLAAAFGAMVGIGASSLLSIKLGQNDRESAMSILGNTFLLNTIIGLAFGITCFAFLDPILYAFGASDDTIVYAREFMRILLLGNVVTHIYLGLNNVMRASGYPTRSMLIMLAAVVSNCIMNPIFIFGFGWGIAGSAWATVIAQTIAMALELLHFSNGKREIHFTRTIFRLKKKIVRGILSIGTAPFLMNVTASVVVIFINNALKTHGGDMHIGAYGIINRIALIFFMIIFGLNQGMQPIVGYNYGARKYDRVKQTLKIAAVLAVIITSCGFIISFVFPRTVAMAFTDDEVLLRVSEEGLRIAMFAFPIVGFQVVTSSFFQSIGKPAKAIFLSLTRQLIFLLPLLIILPRFLGTRGVWISMPIADSLSSVLAIVMLARQIKQLNSMNEPLKPK